jgi:hypothetical protein
MDLAYALLFAAAACCLDPTGVSAAHVESDELTYAMSSGERFDFWIHDGRVEVILSGTDLFFEGKVCSDQQVLCADLIFGIVAVPKAPLTALASWQAEGVRFQAEAPIQTKWGQGWRISGVGPTISETFNYVPGVGLVELRVIKSGRPGWRRGTPIRLIGDRGVLAGD